MQVTLCNASKVLCVIGDPVFHSKSPLIQNTMISALGLPYIYLCQPVLAGQAAQFLTCAKALGYAGFNATMPHKVDLVPLMDELDEDAKLYQAVNTVCIKEGRVYGYNTDGRGFLRSLPHAGADLAGKRVVVLGAGGAAKAVALKLVQQGVSSLTVCNRSREKAALLCQFNPSVMTPAGLDRAILHRVAAQADLLVNCTSLGMEGVPGQFEDLSFVEALPAGAVVYDLIYHPAETQLLARARAGGYQALNGLGMLLYQAIFALEHFADLSLDGPAMVALVERVLSCNAC